MNSIFISSTFRDMNRERDVLNLRVAPKINHRLSPYNQAVRILDLRWGVDTSDMTEQEASRQVLERCMSAIDHCRPYFVVLLGDRYGYIPDGNEVSVTHLEILRGVLEHTDTDHVHVFFRDADYTGMPEEYRSTYIEQQPHAAAKLAALKQELEAAIPHRCHHYRAAWSQTHACLVSEEFESLVVEQLAQDLLETYRDLRYFSDLHKQICENEGTLAENREMAYANHHKLAAEIDAIRQAEMPYAIIGDGGAGKSVYMSLLCSALREEGQDAHVLFCGDNAFSASARNAAEMTLRILTEACGEAYDYEKNALLSYNDLIDRLIQKREAVTDTHYLFLDAVDKCDAQMHHFIYWCARFLPTQVKVVISSRMNEAMKERSGSFVCAPMAYDREDYRNMADCILRRHGKSIPAGHVEMVLDKVTSPLVLHLLLLRLLTLSKTDFDAIRQMGDGIDAIHRYLQQVIENSPSDPVHLAKDYLLSAMRNCANAHFASLLLGFLAYCEDGLREEDLRGLCHSNKTRWVELRYQEFLELYGYCLRQRDNGRISLSHDVIRLAVRGMCHDLQQSLCQAIATYFLQQSEWDALSIHTLFDVIEIGQLSPLLGQFLAKHYKKLHSFEKAPETAAQEIRNGVLRLFLKDRGKLLLAAIASCKDPTDVPKAQMTISSALLNLNDYLAEDVVLAIANFCIAIPMTIYPQELFDVEYAACIRFLQRNKVRPQEIDKYVAQCAEQAAKRGKTINGSREGDCMAALAALKEKDETGRVIEWLNLSKTAREMAQHADTNRDAEELCLGLLGLLEDGAVVLDDEQIHIAYADIYTSLGVAYKALKRWEEALKYDRKSLDIYRRLYEESPSEVSFRKYRERVYNVANIVEAWAIDANDNTDLWEQTAHYYQEMYRLDLLAVAQGISERDAIQTASAILSLGTALLHCGRHEEGIAKYREGLGLFEDATKNNLNADLYADATTHAFECIYHLLLFRLWDAAEAISDNLHTYLSALIASGHTEMLKQLEVFYTSFSNQLNSMVDTCGKQKDLVGQQAISRILYRTYLILLPIAPSPIRANIIITKCNIAAVYFWQEQDYATAYEEYRELLDLVLEKDLVAPDENGQYNDFIISRVLDVYYRIIICLEKLDRQDELKEWMEKADFWAEYISAHSVRFCGDIPYVFYGFFEMLMRNGSAQAMVFLMKAFSAMRAEGYDHETHKETVAAILRVLNLFGGAKQ